MDSIWAAPIGGVPRKLLDESAAVPGGTGSFLDLTSGTAITGSLRVRNGTLLFYASDSAQDASRGGLFTMPVTGGPVTRLMNYRTPNPGGGVFYTQIANGGFGDYAFDGRVVFKGRNDSNSVGGIYAANADGSGLTTIIDNRTRCHPEMFFPTGNFFSPWVSGGNVVFYAGTTADPSVGFNAMYLNNCTSELVASNSPLPGNPNANPHTRIGANTIRLEGSTVVFMADDANRGRQLISRGSFAFRARVAG